MRGRASAFGETFKTGIKTHVFKNRQLLVQSIFLGNYAQAFLNAARLEGRIIAENVAESPPRSAPRLHKDSR